jgi:DNA-binding IclR family transcriptional regulator
MAYTFHELREKTIQELRDIAKDVHHDAVQGYSQMNKDHLLPALCKALGIDTHEHTAVVGIDKPAIKAKMRTLKRHRDAALEAHDHAQLKSVRRQLHALNRQIRAHVGRGAHA